MNSKNLKRLRARVRFHFGTLPVRATEEGTKGVVMVPDFLGGLNPDGTLRSFPFVTTGTLTNHLQSQRGVYRMLKRTPGLSAV